MLLGLALFGGALAFALFSSSSDKRPAAAAPPALPAKERAAARMALSAWAAANRTRFGDPDGVPYRARPADLLAPWNDRDRWVLSQFQRQEAPMGRTDGELDARTVEALKAWAKDHPADFLAYVASVGQSGGVMPPGGVRV